MKVPADRSYSKTHEWFLAEGDVVTIGITQYAADELTDITYVELPEIGTEVLEESSIVEVESVKATSEVLTAISGTIVEVNTGLVDHPERINDDAFGEGWLVKLKVESTDALDALLSADRYAASTE